MKNMAMSDKNITLYILTASALYIKQMAIEEKLNEALLETSPQGRSVKIKSAIELNRQLKKMLDDFFDVLANLD